MVKIPILRWGQPYESLEFDKVVHFVTGETLAQVGQANPGLLAKDMKKAHRARDVLREVPIRQLVEGRAALAFDGHGGLVLEQRSHQSL